MFHLDHGSDFTSRHLEQVMADLRVRPVFSKKGQPHGHGKIERLIQTVNQMCLAHLPGYAPTGTKDRAGQAKLTLAELDTAIGRFFREVYNLRPHSETRVPPQARWESGAFIPRMPDSLEQFDLLLCTVAKPRKVHTDGIQFLALRYIDPVLADYVSEQVTIRYDPRDITEIRVYLRSGDGTDHTFLCRAICPELSSETVSLKDITATRSAVVTTLLAVHDEPLPAAYPATSLRQWTTPAHTPPTSVPSPASGQADTPTRVVYPLYATVRLPHPMDQALRLVPPTIGTHRPDGAGATIVEIGGNDADPSTTSSAWEPGSESCHRTGVSVRLVQSGTPE